MRPHFSPQIYPETSKVCAKATWLSIAAVQLTPSKEIRLKKTPEGRGRCENVEDVCNTFCLQITTKPLEVGSEQDGVGMGHFSASGAADAPRPANATCLRNLVQGSSPIGSPLPVRIRGHGPSPAMSASYASPGMTRPPLTIGTGRPSGV